jgi:hypothetical protein
LSETAQITPNNPNRTDCKLLIPNNRDAATLIGKQEVISSIPVTSTKYLPAKEYRLRDYPSNYMVPTKNLIGSAVAVCVCGESYTGECVPASVGVQVCELLIGPSSSDNSAAAGARTSRTYGHGSSFGLLGSVWDDCWVHPEG